MKRIVSALLILSLCINFISCGRELVIQEDPEISEEETRETSQTPEYTKKHLKLGEVSEELIKKMLMIEDTHEVIENADFSRLEKLYAGKTLSYGSLHEHSNSGGKSDGKVNIGDWPKNMEKFGMDFIAIVDHKQMRGFFLPEWDTNKFIYGTEPAANLTDLEGAKKSSFHYLMLFKDKYDLKKVMDAFPEYKWEGDELNGSFTYPSFKQSRFKELVKFVQSLGGAIVHCHPYGTEGQYMDSNNPSDYCLGEFTFMETIYYEGPYTDYSKKQYELWVDALNDGNHVYNSASGDIHSYASNGGISTFYTKAKNGSAFLDTMISGNFTAGFMGIKMNIGNNAMGSIAHYKAGDILTIEAADLYTKRSEVAADGNYYLRVFTENGLCAYTKIDNQSITRLALKVQDRSYYRADIFDVKKGCAIAISNPIWCN